jgi:hypothetical protein
MCLVGLFVYYRSKPTLLTDSKRGDGACLGLTGSRPDGTELTPLGETVLRFALSYYGSVALLGQRQ